MDPVTKPAFQAFAVQHICTLLALIGLSAALPVAVGALRSPRAVSLGRRILGWLLLAVKGGELAWYSAQGVDWPWLLPLHLCDLAGIAAAGALLLSHRRLFELTYFWGLGGTLQALLTPDLQAGFPRLEYWLFFVPHGLVLVAVCYSISLLGMRPGPGSVGRAFLATLLACVPAGLANWRFGTNYMYLRAKPEAASLLDMLGPWPWYILASLPVALAFLLLWYSPFWWANRRRAAR